MTDTHKQQAGFSIIEVVIGVVVIGLILGAGWFAYEHNKPKPGNANQGASPPAADQPTPAEPNPAVTYLDIKEWGVRVPLPDSIKDAYYVVGAFSDSPDGLPGGVFLGLESLTTSVCDPNNNNQGGTGAIGAILRFLPSETDAVTGELLTEKYPNGTTISGYYYGYQSWNNPGCKASNAAAADTAFAATAREITLAD
jgi:prepilin-type N-terminal cleavage/methylation domain-containing protein